MISVAVHDSCTWTTKVDVHDEFVTEQRTVGSPNASAVLIYLRRLHRGFMDIISHDPVVAVRPDQGLDHCRRGAIQIFNALTWTFKSGPYRTRTCDPLRVMQVRYQLRQRPPTGAHRITAPILPGLIRASEDGPRSPLPPWSWHH
jgi:hypothetical protein